MPATVPRWRRAVTGWSFAAPFTALFLVFALLPVVASLVMSVTDLRATDLRHPSRSTSSGSTTICGCSTTSCSGGPRSTR
ncbi:hypothetical protein [Paractinoplanes durhamensis]|uniref:hypothetical protein n=1 Tax=Paractinoplanes durhamensis TaxID=113563 RepID=UPI00363C5932